MQIEYATDVGRRRKNNQDAMGSFINQSDIPIVIVADGMGGHLAGDVASQLVVSTLGDNWEKNEISKHEEAVQWLIQEIQMLNEEVFRIGSESSATTGMGTTVVTGVMIEKHFIVAHVGDSRAYLLREGILKQITDDHSLVNELYKSGEISAEIAQKHPQKNILTRTIGMPMEVEVDVADFEAVIGDKYIFCSDGLTNMLDDQQILEILTSDISLKEQVAQLIDAANQAGGLDNITVLVVEVDDNGGNV